MTNEFWSKLYRKQIFRKRINGKSFCNARDYYVNIARCALYKHATCLAFTSGKRLPSLLNKKLGFITFLLLFSNLENYSLLFLFHNTTKKKGDTQDSYIQEKGYFTQKPGFICK